MSAAENAEKYARAFSAMYSVGDQPITQTPVMDELAKALANLQTKRKANQCLDDAWDWLESAAVDVLDLYKPEGK